MLSKFHLAILLLILVGNSYVGNAANILFFFTGGTYSHDISIWPLVVRLADRNHSVTFYSAHPKKPWNDSRINVVAPSKIEEINSRYLGDTLSLRLQHQEYVVWKSIPGWSYEICEYIVTNPEKPESEVLFFKERYDLVIIDSVLCDCGYIIAHYHNAKVILSDSTSLFPWYFHIFGFSPESAWLPSTSAFFQYPMSALNILENYVEPFYWTYFRRTWLYPKLELLMSDLLKTTPPSFLELERKTHLIFANTHPSVEMPRSVPPNIIDIGGMQMWGQKNATISESIKKFVEDAEQGVILLAFGSSVDFSNIPKNIEEIFFETFRRFPRINFIVKASSTRPDNCPTNLRYEKWIPQKEILAHRKTVACITHGGLNGILEATYLGMPLITIPIFAEQDYQSYKLEVRELGIRLEMRDLTVEALTKAISDIITDPKYRDNMKKMQAVFRDRKESPLELATFYTEYALRHDDLSFMSPIKYQQWRVYLEDCFFSIHSSFIAVIVILLITAYAIRKSI